MQLLIRKKKQQAKTQLLNEVEDWIHNDTENAKLEFGKSAREIVKYLKAIEAEICDKDHDDKQKQTIEPKNESVPAVS